MGAHGVQHQCVRPATRRAATRDHVGVGSGDSINQRTTVRNVDRRRQALPLAHSQQQRHACQRLPPVYVATPAVLAEAKPGGACSTSQSAATERSRRS